MNWRKWWALEVLTGLMIFVAIWPLDLFRFFVTTFLITLFAVFYLQRVTNQKHGHDLVYYGPHRCPRECGAMVVRVSREQGGKMFDYPSAPIYPNTIWREHECHAHECQYQEAE